MKTLTKIQLLILFVTPGLSIGQTMPNLGSNASTFILYTPSGALDNVGGSEVYGNVGTNNSGEYAGFTPGTVLKGNSHINDQVSTDAGTELQAAYTDFAANTTCQETLLSTLSGPQNLQPNIFCTLGATAITGDITLNGNGDPNAVFLFKIGGALSFAADARILLTGGTQISNVYFQVDGAVELGTGSVFRGTVVADGAIELLGNSSLYGKALSISGAIHLHDNIVASSEIALPVTLVSFNASKSDYNTAYLVWTTTAETNSDRFEIEYSVIGKVWQKIGTVAASGESKKLKTYTFNSESIPSEINLYRLKIIDQDETFVYSRIRSIDFSENSNSILYPNPAVDQLTLNVQDLSKIERIRLNDINGKIRYDERKTESTNLSPSINIKSYPPGLYIVSVTSTTGAVSYIKILKQ
jgi:hypothetical protein